MCKRWDAFLFQNAVDEFSYFILLNGKKKNNQTIRVGTKAQRISMTKKPPKVVRDPPQTLTSHETQCEGSHARYRYTVRHRVRQPFRLLVHTHCLQPAVHLVSGHRNPSCAHGWAHRGVCNPLGSAWKMFPSGDHPGCNQLWHQLCWAEVYGWLCSRAKRRRRTQPRYFIFLRGKEKKKKREKKRLQTTESSREKQRAETKAAWIINKRGKKNRSFVLKWSHKMWNFKIRWLGLWFLSFKWIDLLLNCCSRAKKL